MDRIINTSEKTTFNISALSLTYFQLISQIRQKVHFVNNFLIKKLKQKNIYINICMLIDATTIKHV